MPPTVPMENAAKRDLLINCVCVCVCARTSFNFSPRTIYQDNFLPNLAQNIKVHN